MAKYAAFLRGINVGNIRIKMTDLQACFRDLGFDEVKTFLQTGNVVFNTNKLPGSLVKTIETELSDRFHYTAYVQIYALPELQQIIENYPFAALDNYHRYVTFVSDAEVIPKIIDEAAQFEWIDEEIQAATQVIYWRVPKGNTIDSSFGKISAKSAFKKVLTTRNINTLEKMVSAA